MILIVLFAVALALAYKWYTSIYSYWETRGFPFVEGKFPFGSEPCLSNPKKFLGVEVEDLYKKLAGHHFGGVYVGRRTDLIVRDPKLIKYIMVKDFNFFRDRAPERSSSKNPLSQHLFSLEGWKWRSLRVKLTPTFTSGKLKLMYSLFMACAEKLENKMAEEQEKNGGVLDIKEVISRFTTDIIGSCAFGVETNSLFNEDEPFRQLGKRLFEKNPRARFIALVNSILPKLASLIRLSTMSKDLERSFLDIIAQNIEYRETHNVKRNDFLDLLLELKNKGSLDVDPQVVKNGHVKEIDMDLGMITAQCFVFFIAGFETSSSVQSYALYELAFHQVVQDRLRREIEEVSEKYGGINYQALHDMPYLDQVINETIRKYPTLHTLSRVCTKDYQIPGTELTIEEGTRIIIPIYSLHHDPQYFPDPDRFDPERFSEQNKSSITPYTFLPFGEGPRNCIGMRFGLLQTKMGLVTILMRHRVLPTNKTASPLVMRNSLSVISLVEGPIVLKLQRV